MLCEYNRLFFFSSVLGMYNVFYSLEICSLMIRPCWQPLDSPLFSPNCGWFSPYFLITHTQFSFTCSSTISLCLYTHSPEILDNLFSHAYFFGILQVWYGRETIHCRYRSLHIIASSKMRFPIFFLLKSIKILNSWLYDVQSIGEIWMRSAIDTGVTERFRKTADLLGISPAENVVAVNWNPNCCYSVVKLCLTLRLYGLQHARLLSSTIPWSLFIFMSIESVRLSNYIILCCPLLLLPSIFPSIRVFSNKLAPCIRWPKYWSFSCISPSNEYSGLISFRTDWFDLFPVKGTQAILQYHNLKASILWCLVFSMVHLSHP